MCIFKFAIIENYSSQLQDLLHTVSAQAAVQECREACGGHGFLAVAGLGKLRGDNDANCTYEGDNTVLLQQTSQWLLGLTKYGRVESPMGSVGWLGDLINNSGETLNSWSEGKMNLDLRSPEGALIALRVLVWRLLRATELEVTFSFSAFPPVPRRLH